MHTIKPKDSLEDITTQLYNINKVIQALYYKPGAWRARIHKLAYKRQRKHQISEYRYKRKTERPIRRRGKTKATIERHRPPAWDPPILLLVVAQLIEVSTLGVVVAIVSGCSGLRGYA